MNRDVVKAVGLGILATLILVLLIVIGSRNLAHFDAALIGYTFAILFAVFGITYRYTMWLQRPPTAKYWRRGWQAFFHRGMVGRNIGTWFRRMIGEIALNNFIWPRGRLRWAAHWLLMWGCIGALIITHMLVFGWLHFQSLANAPEWYRVFVFGFPTIAFPASSLFGLLLFHGLVWVSFPVLAGVMLAMRRRMRDEGAVAVQMFAEDFLPLILLFAVTITGLLLTVSYTWLRGYAYTFIAILHAITVIVFLLQLPFGKFFHIFQRPAQLGVGFYKDVGEREAKAHCRRCGHPFTSEMHVKDLIDVERKLGYRYEMPDGQAEHYQWICPPCRRAMFALAQRQLWRSEIFGTQARAEAAPLPQPMPVYVNPGRGEGPLGEEDAKNFHP